MTKPLKLIFILCMSIQAQSQTFTKDHFSYKGECNLERKVNQTIEDGKQISVYECLTSTSSSTVTAYRVNVISNTEIIRNISLYIRSVYEESSLKGSVNYTKLSNTKAVQLLEDVYIEGHSMKQISISTLHKNKSITIVLVTNEDNYLELLRIFKSHFKLI